MASFSLVEQVREIPLESILAYHGLAPHREGSSVRYKDERFNIVVSSGGLWFDNAASLGGRGAIDLLLHVKYGANPRAASDQQFREAVGWLATFQPTTGVVSMGEPSASSPRPPKESFLSQAARLATRDDARWPLARSYLLQTRRLPSDLVDHLHQAGDIYATFSQVNPEQTGVCFVHRNLDDGARGATIRSIGSGSFSIGEKQGAWFGVGDPAQARRAVLVEAPIDALSYAALERPEETIILSMSGSHATRPVLDAAHARHWELAIGFDNDRAGHAGWERCRENYALLYPAAPQPTRILPAGKDWNDDLRAAPRRNHGRRL
jgi:Toprim-like